MIKPAKCMICGNNRCFSYPQKHTKTHTQKQQHAFVFHLCFPIYKCIRIAESAGLCVTWTLTGFLLMGLITGDHNIKSRINDQYWKMSHCIRKPTICIMRTEAPDQLCSNNYTYVQRLCFRYTNKTIPFCHTHVTVQAGLCQSWSELQIVCFPMRRLKYYFG